jgi:GDP-L-fucose synthase
MDILLKLLITGTSGLLGSAVLKQAKDIYEIISPTRLELDLEDSSAVSAFVVALQPDYCIHAAAHVFGLGGHKLHPNRALFLNSKIDLNLISALNETRVEHFVYVATVASYGYPYIRQPLVESDFLLGVPHASEYGYAMAKRFGYDLSNSLKLNGTTVTYAVMTNMFGPFDNFNEKTGHVIPSLISRAVTAKSTNSSLQIWGDKSDSRDFLYSEIAATRILQMLYSKFDGLINIASGVERNIYDVAKRITEYLEISKIETKFGAVNAIHKRTLDVQLLEGRFGSIPDRFDENLINTIEWYLANIKDARR